MISKGNKVVAVSGAAITTLHNPDNINFEVGDIGVVESILPYHEPCHPRFKGQSFATISFKKNTGYKIVSGVFAFDVRDLRKVEL